MIVIQGCAMVSAPLDPAPCAPGAVVAASLDPDPCAPGAVVRLCNLRGALGGYNDQLVSPKRAESTSKYDKFAVDVLSGEQAGTGSWPSLI